MSPKQGPGDKKKWYYTGSEGEKRGTAWDAEKKAKAEQRQNQVRRFRQKNDESTKVIMLDDPKFYFFEHQVELNGSFYNYFTCVGEIDNCPLDESGDSPYFAVAATIINPKGYLDKDGIRHKNQKNLLVCKSEARERIKKLLAKHGTLKYCILEFSRGANSKEVSTGASIDYIGPVAKSDKEATKKIMALCPEEFKDGKEKYVEPYDYLKILAPKPSADLRKMLGMANPIGSNEEEAELDLGLDPDESGVGSEEEGEEVSDDDTALEDLI